MGKIELPKVFKTDEQRDRIREAIKHSFLFVGRALSNEKRFRAGWQFYVCQGA